MYGFCWEIVLGRSIFFCALRHVVLPYRFGRIFGGSHFISTRTFGFSLYVDKTFTWIICLFFIKIIFLLEFSILLCSLQCFRAKRYPIKVESKESKIYKGTKTLYIYLDTSWEKEAWCKALRLASCEDNEKRKWFAKLNLEFQRYVTSLNAEYPSFMKPSMGWNVDLIDKSIKLDGSSSKVRQFLKKLAKKASKSGIDNKAMWTPASAHEERKISEKSRSFQDYGTANMRPKGKSAEDITVPSLLSTTSDIGNRNQASVISDADSEERTLIDEGTLCWNILLSRLFFDAKCNMKFRSSMQARIQVLKDIEPLLYNLLDELKSLNLWILQYSFKGYKRIWCLDEVFGLFFFSS